MQSYKFRISNPCRRLDVLIVDYFEDIGDVFSRNSIQNLIKLGAIRVDGKTSKPSRSLKGGELIEVDIPEQKILDLVPQDIPIRIVYEDDHIIIINKKAGMVVHPAPGNYSDTLVNAVFYTSKGRLSNIGGNTRPGVVHRLDKDTSGLIVMAKDNVSHLDLARQFADKTAGRIYTALVCGVPDKYPQRIETFFSRHPSDRKKFTSKVISGKKAVTNYELIKDNGSASILRLKLETGRTHQIRVHLKDIGYPIIGDKVYGGKNILEVKMSRQALHAGSLTITHPIFRTRMSFFCPLEDDIVELIKELGLC
jgi:23S rRNA pseudouridine1911/1915/1917 synthase